MLIISQEKQSGLGILTTLLLVGVKKASPSLLKL